MKGYNLIIIGVGWLFYVAAFPDSESPRLLPTFGKFQARKDGLIMLECKGSGNPAPSIHWTRKSVNGTRTEQIGKGPVLILNKLERQQSGIYQCTADNGVGIPVTADLQLDVLYPPEIQVAKTWIHVGEGLEAKLICIVYAEPVATTSWYKNSSPIKQTDRAVIFTKGNSHLLIIDDIKKEDFGNYSCVSHNSLGRSRKYMELSGLPEPATFHSSKWGTFSDSYNLTWKINSYAPLVEIRLRFRRISIPDTILEPWQDFKIIPEPRQTSEPLTNIMSHKITHLHFGEYYEAIVQAKNKYGWGEISDIFQFFVAGNYSDTIPEDVENVSKSNSRIIKACCSTLCYLPWFLILSFLY